MVLSRSSRSSKLGAEGLTSCRGQKNPSPSQSSESKRQFRAIRLVCASNGIPPGKVLQVAAAPQVSPFHLCQGRGGGAQVDLTICCSFTFLIGEGETPPTGFSIAPSQNIYLQCENCLQAISLPRYSFSYSFFGWLTHALSKY